MLRKHEIRRIFYRKQLILIKTGKFSHSKRLWTVSYVASVHTCMHAVHGTGAVARGAPESKMVLCPCACVRHKRGGCAVFASTLTADAWFHLAVATCVFLHPGRPKPPDRLPSFSVLRAS